MSESVRESEPVLTESAPPPVMPPPSVGSRLRAAREARSMTPDEAAQLLKLGSRQLEALESDNWSALPGTTFIRGFVRNYARLVQLDPTPLMAQLDDALGSRKPDLALPNHLRANMPTPTRSPRKRDLAFVFLGATLLVVAMLVYFFLPSDLSKVIEAGRSLVNVAARSAETASPAPAASAPSTVEPLLPPNTSVNQVIRPQSLPAASGPANVSENATASAGQAPLLRLSFDKDVWVEVRDRAGRVLFQQVGMAGSERDIEGDPPFALTVGYAAGVRVQLRGQMVDLVPYQRGDVARLTLE